MEDIIEAPCIWWIFLILWKASVEAGEDSLLDKYDCGLFQRLKPAIKGKLSFTIIINSITMFFMKIFGTDIEIYTTKIP